MVGGPAYNTGQLQRGDEILLVDGVESQTVSVLWAIFTRAGMCRGENPEEELVTTKEAALRTVDAAIQLWSKMLLADAQHDQTIADNITDVQAKGKALLAGLLQQLEQLPALFAHA